MILRLDRDSLWCSVLFGDRMSTPFCPVSAFNSVTRGERFRQLDLLNFVVQPDLDLLACLGAGVEHPLDDGGRRWLPHQVQDGLIADRTL
jgi:hypothetical protein